MKNIVLSMILLQGLLFGNSAYCMQSMPIHSADIMSDIGSVNNIALTGLGASGFQVGWQATDRFLERVSPVRFLSRTFLDVLPPVCMATTMRIYGEVLGADQDTLENVLLVPILASIGGIVGRSICEICTTRHGRN